MFYALNHTLDHIRMSMRKSGKIYSPQSTADPEAPVNALDNDLDAFLIGLHFLKCYPRESEQAGMFNISE
jgi:hypothetical protein